METLILINSNLGRMGFPKAFFCQSLLFWFCLSSYQEIHICHVHIDQCHSFLSAHHTVHPHPSLQSISPYLCIAFALELWLYQYIQQHFRRPRFRRLWNLKHGSVYTLFMENMKVADIINRTHLLTADSSNGKNLAWWPRAAVIQRTQPGDHGSSIGKDTAWRLAWHFHGISHFLWL